MGVSSFTQEFSSPISPSRMFKALILDSNILIPKLLPQFIQSVEIIQGVDGAPGTIEQLNFTQASNLKYVRNRIEELDKEKLMCKYTLIEGYPLGDKLDSIAYEVKFEAANDGGCICKITSNYITIGDFTISEDEIKDGKDKSIGIYKVVEAYLLDNPQVYA
ncbi:pathogenesis-related protein STH-2-like [Euphorbia lathyris]|uniref:pathogenesis-related protein STH-2-like n=1 Tax=Euphorbia lathyris TaxID=212925 RepID=UPI0033131D63